MVNKPNFFVHGVLIKNKRENFWNWLFLLYITKIYKHLNESHDRVWLGRQNRGLPSLKFSVWVPPRSSIKLIWQYSWLGPKWKLYNKKKIPHPCRAFINGNFFFFLHITHNKNRGLANRAKDHEITEQVCSSVGGWFFLARASSLLLGTASTASSSTGIRVVVFLAPEYRGVDQVGGTVVPEAGLHRGSRF